MSNVIALDPGLNGRRGHLGPARRNPRQLRSPDDRRRRTTPGAPRLWEASMMDIHSLARALGGEVVGGQVLAPGPGGHSRKDRSLSVRLTLTAPDGFLAFSHAGDDWRACRDYVRERLGLSRETAPRRAAEARQRPSQPRGRTMSPRRKSPPRSPCGPPPSIRAALWLRPISARAGSCLTTSSP